jgi:hypothetical protein
MSLAHRLIPAARPRNFPLMSAAAEVKVTRHPSAELTDDMTVADLLDVLEHLPFGPRGGSCMLQLDRGVRDYLLRALRRR